MIITRWRRANHDRVHLGYAPLLMLFSFAQLRPRGAIELRGNNRFVYSEEQKKRPIDYVRHRSGARASMTNGRPPTERSVKLHLARHASNFRCDIFFHSPLDFFAKRIRPRRQCGAMPIKWVLHCASSVMAPTPAMTFRKQVEIKHEKFGERALVCYLSEAHHSITVSSDTYPFGCGLNVSFVCYRRF